MLSERALTQIAYLMQGLVHAPNKKAFKLMLLKVQSLNGSFDAPLLDALEELLSFLPTRKKFTSDIFCATVDSLFAVQTDYTAAMARSLWWYLLLRDKWYEKFR